MNSLVCLAFMGLLALCAADNAPTSYSEPRPYPPPPRYAYQPPNYGSGYQERQPSRYPAGNSYSGGNAYPAPAPTTYQGGNPAPNTYPAPNRYPGPYASGYGYAPPYQPGYFHGYRLADDLLEALDIQLDNLELQEINQDNQLRRLIKEANKNLDFELNYENTISKDFEKRQAVQNARLSLLEKRVAEITALRESVSQLQDAANAVNNQIENYVYPSRKKIMYDINDLTNIGLDQNSRIEETQTRADNVNDRIDVLLVKAWDNTRDLNEVNTAALRASQSLNRQRTAFVAQNALEPVQAIQTLSQDFPTPVDGVPQFYSTFINGFNFIKEKYAYGMPSVYAASSLEVWNTKADLQYSEMSTGGWRTYKVLTNTGVIFFDTTQLSLK